MQVVVCDVCRAAEDRAAGGLFNLAGNGMAVDICGSCAANVLARLMETAGEQVSQALAVDGRPTRRPTGRPQPRPEAPVDVSDIDSFIEQAHRPADNTRRRIDELTLELGEPVFVQELPNAPRIGSRVALGMAGRKIVRRVEVVEAVPGVPGSYLVFQVKE